MLYLDTSLELCSEKLFIWGSMSNAPAFIIELPDFNEQSDTWNIYIFSDAELGKYFLETLESSSMDMSESIAEYSWDQLRSLMEMKRSKVGHFISDMRIYHCNSTLHNCPTSDFGDKSIRKLIAWVETNSR